MASILLSIHPNYAEAILAGTKRWEYRRRGPRFKVRLARLYLYATTPVSMIIGEAGSWIWADTPEYVWYHTMDGAGISKDDFFDYAKGYEEIAVFEIMPESLKRYERARPLRDFGVVRPPQSWRYIDVSRSPIFAEVTR